MCVTAFIVLATVDVPKTAALLDVTAITTDLPLSTNVPTSNRGANSLDSTSVNIIIITGATGGFAILLILIIALLCCAILLRSRRRIFSMNIEATCITNELNTNNSIELNPLHDVIEPNGVDYSTIDNHTISYPSYNASTEPYDEISEQEYSYIQSYDFVQCLGLDEVKMDANPAYTITERKDCSKTSKEECNHVQLNEFMLYDVTEPNAVDIQSKELIQHQDLNGSTKMNVDPAYAGWSTGEENASTFSADADCSKTSKEECNHVQLNEFMLYDVTEPNAVGMQSKELIQHQYLNGSTKTNVDPAYAGWSAGEDNASTFSVDTVHSNTKAHQSSHDAIVEQHAYDYNHMHNDSLHHNTEASVTDDDSIYIYPATDLNYDTCMACSPYLSHVVNNTEPAGESEDI